MTNNPALDWLLKAAREYPEVEAPVTCNLIAVIIGIFVVEIVLTFWYHLPHIQIFSTGIFGVHPWIAWLLSPFLHRGIEHVVGNVFGLVVLGIPIERHWSRRRFIAFLVIKGYLATACGAVMLLVFSSSKVAYYGTSGIVFALAGFDLTHLLRHHTSLNRIEWCAVFLGVISLGAVLVDPLTGPYFAAHWINGGHITGFLIGTVVGWPTYDGCPLQGDARGVL